ncbi:MAG: ankyrin repeat domain-containing protein [Rickettsiales bacterium]
MKSYLIYGPRTGVQLSSMLHEQFNINKRSIDIYGDGINEINCNEIELLDNAHVIIHAHGSSFGDHKHHIELCNSYYDSHYGYIDSSSKIFQTIAKNKIMNIVLSSCYGGAAINDISSLPQWSTLITIGSSNYPSSTFKNLEVQSNPIVILSSDNPFMNFVAYLYTNPCSTQFAINTQVNNKIFSSFIESLEDFSIPGITKWRNSQLDKFIKFILDIQKHMNQQRIDQIDNLLNLFKDEQAKEEWSNNFDANRYQGLLLIEKSSQGIIEDLKKVIAADVDIDTKLLDNSSALHFAVSINKEIVKVLIQADISVNEENNNGFSPLDIAIQKGSMNIVQLLLAVGAHTKIDNFKDEIEIENEIIKFKLNPIKYILQGNNEAKFALEAIHNLEYNFVELRDELQKVEYCLIAQPSGVIENLNAICGINSLDSTYYDL